jgi:hypothetical protein
MVIVRCRAASDSLLHQLRRHQFSPSSLGVYDSAKMSLAFVNDHHVTSSIPTVEEALVNPNDYQGGAWVRISTFLSKARLYSCLPRFCAIGSYDSEHDFTMDMTPSPYANISYSYPSPKAASINGPEM